MTLVDIQTQYFPRRLTVDIDTSSENRIPSRNPWPIFVLLTEMISSNAPAWMMAPYKLLIKMSFMREQLKQKYSRQKIKLG